MASRVEFTAKISRLKMRMIESGEQVADDFCKRSDEEQFRLHCIGRDLVNASGKGNALDDHLSYKEYRNLILSGAVKWVLLGTVVTKCDGIKDISQHQTGHAVDLLFFDGNSLGAPKQGWAHWHDLWDQMGGSKRLPEDLGHFGMD